MADPAQSVLTGIAQIIGASAHRRFLRTHQHVELHLLEVLDAFLPQKYDAHVVVETRRLRPPIRATAGANGNRPAEPPPDNSHCHALWGDAIHHSLHHPGLASR